MGSKSAINDHSTEEVVPSLLSFLDSFRTYEFRALVRQKLGKKHENRTSQMLTELIEDGVIKRVSIGEYIILKRETDSI